MNSIPALIDKLASAVEGSRELDAEIALFVGWQRHLIGDESRGYFVPRQQFWVSPEDAKSETNYPQRHEHPPAYTTSLDAALTLLPEGWRITHAYGPPWTWCLTHGKERKFTEGKAPTPALALCIASLRARMAEEG